MASIKEFQLITACPGNRYKGKKDSFPYSLFSPRSGQDSKAQAQLCCVTLGEPSPSLGDLLGRKAGARAAGKGLGWQGHKLGCTRRR